MHTVCSQESGNMIFILECSQFISFLFSFSLRTTHSIYKRKSFSHFLCLHLSFFIFLFYSVFIAFPTVQRVQCAAWKVNYKTSACFHLFLTPCKERKTIIEEIFIFYLSLNMHHVTFTYTSSVSSTLSSQSTK